MPDYKKNFLVKVVVRIDFEQLDLSKISGFLSQIKDTFPNSSKELTYETQFEFKIDKGGPVSNQVSNPLELWNLSTADQTRSAQISPKWLWIEYGKYKDSKQVLDDIKIIDLFVDHFGIEEVKRIGILYSNVVTPTNNTNPTQWADYINPKLLPGIDFASTNDFAISRCMGQIVKHSDNNDLRLDYGIWNPDFPNQIARKEFILQYDCFTNLAMEVRDITLSEIIKDFKQQIEDLFEQSITEKLRDIMRKG